MDRRVVRWCLSLGLLLLSSSCATARHREALYAATYQYIYPQPIEKVWPELVRLVTAQGYGPRKSDEEFILVTEWRNDMMSSRVVSSASRVYAEGYRVNDNSSAIRIFRQTIFTGNKGTMTARDNAFVDSLTVAAAGDILPGSEDPIKLNQFLGTSADSTPLTRSPAQLNRSVGRDGELEWELLKLIDVEAAQDIESHITARENE
jgi:hypothetical protein